MNLIVDIGNSFIKVAVVEHDEVLELRRYQSLEEFAGSNIVAEFPFLHRAIVASTAMATREVAELLENWGLWGYSCFALPALVMAFNSSFPDMLSLS